MREAGGNQLKLCRCAARICGGETERARRACSPQARKPPRHAPGGLFRVSEECPHGVPAVHERCKARRAAATPRNLRPQGVKDRGVQGLPQCGQEGKAAPGFTLFGGGGCGLRGARL